MQDFKVGQKFGRLVIVRLVSGRRCECICDCGNTKTVFVKNLLRGVTTSCGCYRKEVTRARSLTHGASNRTPEYTVWAGIIARCYNKNASGYENYGGRGITVCGRWKSSFSNFLADMGAKPSASHTIERCDNQKQYSPDNCIWATRTTNNNNKRTCVFIEYDGQRLTVAQWAKFFGMPARKLRTRLRYGYALLDAASSVDHRTKAVRVLRGRSRP